MGQKHRSRLLVTTLASFAGLIALWSGWNHYYDKNYRAGESVLNEVKAFRTIDNNVQKILMVAQLPVLNPLREATLAYGNHRDKNAVF